MNDFLNKLPDNLRDDIRALDAMITDIFADEQRVMWEGTFWGGTEQAIIGYGDLLQPRSRGEPVRWFMVGLALQKSGISVYVNAVKGGQYLGKEYGTRLGKVKFGSASIEFRKLENSKIGDFVAMIRAPRDLS